MQPDSPADSSIDAAYDIADALAAQLQVQRRTLLVQAPRHEPVGKERT